MDGYHWYERTMPCLSSLEALLRQTTLLYVNDSRHVCILGRDDRLGCGMGGMIPR